MTLTGCGHEMRPFVYALVGIVGHRFTEWTNVDDLTLGTAAGAWAGSNGACRKWTQRKRKLVMEWNKRTDKPFILCWPGGRTPEGLNFPSKYLLPVVELSLITAERALNSTSKNRHRAIDSIARQVLADFEPVAQPEFKPAPIEDPTKFLSTIATPLRRVADHAEQKGYSEVPDFVLSDILNSLKKLRKK